jgi:hypothetical protein
MKTTLVMILLYGLAGCVSNPIKGDKEPFEAASICIEDMPVEFVYDGHIYTTLALTHISGYSDKRQLMLSYYSQYPDIDIDYEAVPVSLKYLFLPWKWEWRNDITGGLHSLHGGNRVEINNRRTNIRNAVSQTLPYEKYDWLTGLIIHAYGDAYAHTKNTYNSPSESAYNVWIGHAIPSLLRNSPDKIKKSLNEPKYLGYINDFYSSIQQSSDTDAEFLKFHDFVDNLECKGHHCPDFHALYNSELPSKESRINKFTVCMNKTARQLSVNEVQHAIDLIKGKTTSIFP